jgi:hypothetical protein
VGFHVEVVDLGDGSCLLPGEAEAPNLFVPDTAAVSFDGWRLVLGPGQRRFIPHSAADGRCVTPGGAR